MIWPWRRSAAVLLVCTANICRSPLAEGMLRAELRQRGVGRRFRIDSAGTRASQPGHPPDPRAVEIASRGGVTLRRHRARQLVQRDFSRFDYLLAVDGGNLDWLLRHSPPGQVQRVQHLDSWTPGEPEDIPDPYYSNRAAFELVWERLVPAVNAFADQLLLDFPTP